jgi:hypothetical protein
MKQRLPATLFLSLVWALCLLHCMGAPLVALRHQSDRESSRASKSSCCDAAESDSASVHSEQRHNHGHACPGQPEEQGCQTLCCSDKLLPSFSLSATLERDLVASIFDTAYSASISTHPTMVLATATETRHDTGQDPRLQQRIASLRSPNAPPNMPIQL